MGFTPYKAEEPLLGMKLQEKEEEKIKNKQKCCLETTLKIKCVMTLDFWVVVGSIFIPLLVFP